MDKENGEKIRSIGEERSHAHEQLIKRGSKVYKAFLEMERNA